MQITEELLKNEESIVWMEDIEKYDYVRETMDEFARNRSGKPSEKWIKLIGYATLKADTPNNGNPGHFNRRIFWVQPHDRNGSVASHYAYGMPSEGVDPRTVAAGKPGEATDRAMGRLPQEK